MIGPSFIKALKEDKNNISIKDWVEDVFWYSKFSCFLRKSGRFVKRLGRWLPVLWNQEDWDYEYIYDLLIMKMKELKEDMSKDYWHDQKEVQRGIKQIDICLKRLDMYLNWTNYYDYPMEDIYYEPTSNGCMKMCYSSEENEKQRAGALDFEEKNFNKFWKDFIKWHRGWWT